MSVVWCGMPWSVFCAPAALVLRFCGLAAQRHYKANVKNLITWFLRWNKFSLFSCSSDFLERRDKFVLACFCVLAPAGEEIRGRATVVSTFQDLRCCWMKMHVCIFRQHRQCMYKYVSSLVFSNFMNRKLWRGRLSHSLWFQKHAGQFAVACLN